MSRITRIFAVGCLALIALVAAAPSALAAKPEIVHSGKYTDTFFDDFIFDLCGIETMTTVTERWTLTTYADGSQKFTNSRKFVPLNPALRWIEYGAGMSTFDVNGVQTVHGSPIPVQIRGEGMILLDAGYITLTDDATVHGPHPSLGMDLADVYCP